MKRANIAIILGILSFLVVLSGVLVFIFVPVQQGVYVDSGSIDFDENIEFESPLIVISRTTGVRNLSMSFVADGIPVKEPFCVRHNRFKSVQSNCFDYAVSEGLTSSKGVVTSGCGGDVSRPCVCKSNEDSCFLKKRSPITGELVVSLEGELLGVVSAESPVLETGDLAGIVNLACEDVFRSDECRYGASSCSCDLQPDFSGDWSFNVFVSGSAVNGDISDTDFAVQIKNDALCSNGVLDNEEIKVDCGGPSCSSCPLAFMEKLVLFKNSIPVSIYLLSGVLFLLLFSFFVMSRRK